MGIKEYIIAGSERIKREKVAISLSNSDQQQSGSIVLGSAVTITEIQSTKACRFRLYGHTSGRDDAGEKIRPFVSQSVSSSVGLIIDTDITNISPFTINPAIFGTNLDNPVSSTLYYTVESGSGGSLTAGDTITITRLLMEDLNYPSINNRKTLVTSGSGLSSGSSITGSIQSPKTYLLYKVEPTAVPLRLRLYTAASYRDDATEIARPFSTEPNSGSGLIADIFMEDLAATPMVPIVVGRNDDDNNDFAITEPNSTTYFRLTNGSATTTVSASLYVYSLED